MHDHRASWLNSSYHALKIIEHTMFQTDHEGFLFAQHGLEADAVKPKVKLNVWLLAQELT